MSESKRCESVGPKRHRCLYNAGHTEKHLCWFGCGESDEWTDDEARPLSDWEWLTPEPST